MTLLAPRAEDPEVSAAQIAEIDAIVATEQSPWKPTGQRTGITFTDIFCGFGGSSIGLENAGHTLVLGANHWSKAIETHALNFLGADHLIADVSNYDMRRLPATDVLWASPICTELSPAGGTRRAQLSLLEVDGPVQSAALERTRATFWDVVRATEVHRYKIVLVENVVEASRWELFDIWVSAMDKLGYNHQFVSVSSAHIGDDTNPHAPQWRDRLYIVFTATSLPTIRIAPRPLAWCSVCDEINGAVQAWKRADRRPIGKYRQQYVYRCPNRACNHSVVEPFVRPAAAAIDWSDLGQRIGDRAKPLAAATMRRIRAGLEQFAQPAMIATNHSDGDNRSYPADGAPLPTRSTKIGDGVACPPFLLDRRAYHDGDARRIHPITDPVGAITANGRPHTLVSPPMIVPAGGTWNDSATRVDEPIRTRTTRDTDGLFTAPFITVLRNHADGAPITEPLATVSAGGGTGGGHQALTVPAGAFIQKHHGGVTYNNIGHMTKSVNEPLPGLVARVNTSLVIPYRRGRAKTTREPLHTLATRDSAALVCADGIDVDDCHFRMLNPGEHALAQRFPDTYRVARGTTKGEMTMGYGNAVSSNVAQWLGGYVTRILAGAGR